MPLVSVFLWSCSLDDLFLVMSKNVYKKTTLIKRGYQVLCAERGILGRTRATLRTEHSTD